MIMNETINKQQYQSYAAATQTVAKTQQIVMLYDGVIRFIQQAKDAINDKRIEDRYKILTKASDVIMGLQACLDFDNGGQIARVLYSYYSSIDSRIFSVHRSNNLETCDEIIGDLKKMRDVWNEIDQNTVQQDGQVKTSTPSNNSTPDTQQGITLSA